MLTPYTVGDIGGPPPSASSGPLSYSQVVALAQQAGLSYAKALTAAAIAFAESGGRPTAHNGVAPDNSYGLWQINMIGALGPARRAQLGIATNEDLYDPATNARAMFLLSGGGDNWRPWTTFTSGAYKAFLGGGADTSTGTERGDTGANTNPLGGDAGAGSSNTDESDCLLGGGDVLPSWVPFGASAPCIFYKSWGYAILGGLVLVAGAATMVIGAVLLAGSSSTVKGALGVVTSKGRTIPTNLARSSSSSSSASASSADDAAGRADYERFLLEQQAEAPAPSVRTAREGVTRAHTSRPAAGRARAHRVEEPF